MLYGFIFFLFYRSFLISFIAIPISFLYIKQKKEQLKEERQWQLMLQFRDGITSLSNSLNAGYSIENAFSEAIIDLKTIYEEDAYIIKEFHFIISRLKRNETIEDILYEFADRTGIEDIYNFAQVFITAKRTGGNIIKIIRNTSKSIGDKIEIKREIKTLITAKKYESRIMNLIPFGMILYMWCFSPGFLDPLYHNVMGVIIMTGAMLAYYGAYCLSEKIMNINI